MFIVFETKTRAKVLDGAAASAAEQALAVDDDTAFAVLKSRRGKK